VLADPRPAAVLAGLHALVEGEPAALGSTVVHVVLDPRTGAFRWGSAGHVPPLVARADGDVAPLAPPGGAVLGVAAPEGWAERTEHLARSDRLALFPDGLVERAGEGVEAALGELARLLVAAEGVEACCSAAFATLLRDAPPDDVTLLVAELG
jgi:serine phosphatase RsbU (regulator of sigma subunit)